MGGITLALIVSSFAVGSAVLVGVLGLLIDKSAEPEPVDHKTKGKGA
jgi:hypothetical protein